MTALEQLYHERAAQPSDINEHLETLVGLVEELSATQVIELGTRGGCSTVAWLYALEDRGHLWSVDLDPRPDLGDYDHWTFIQGDDCSPDAFSHIPLFADIVFIDTSHEYQHTLKELALYLPRVRSGGRIVLHDTELEQPEGIGPSIPFPVKRAVETFCASHGLVWTNHTNNNGLGIVEVV